MSIRFFSVLSAGVFLMVSALPSDSLSAQTIRSEVSNAAVDSLVDGELQQETLEIKPQVMDAESIRVFWVDVERSVDYLTQPKVQTTAQEKVAPAIPTEKDYRAILISLGFDRQKAAQLNEVMKTIFKKYPAEIANLGDPEFRARVLIEAGILAAPQTETAPADDAQLEADRAIQDAHRAALDQVQEAVKETSIQNRLESIIRSTTDQI